MTEATSAKKLLLIAPVSHKSLSIYDANHVVFRPKKISPERLLEGYLGALKHVYSVPSIFKRLWGTTAWKNFFYPMNLGFRQSVSRLSRVST